MELRRLGRLLGVLAAITLIGCATRPALRGVVPLAGDGAHAWVYVETPDETRNGIWLCTSPEGPEPRPRCVQAEWMKWAPTAAPAGEAAPRPAAVHPTTAAR